MYTKYNSLAICATYRLYTIHNTLMLYAVYSVLAIHYAYRIHKYIVEVLEKIMRRMKMIDHSFKRKFYGSKKIKLKKNCKIYVNRISKMSALK